MQRLTCELCGSTDLIKTDGVFVCQACGCKYSIEEARKMMVEGVVEVRGTVKQDRSDELVRLLELARGGIDSNNSKDAESYAMRALEIDLNSGKAWAIKAEAIDWQMTLADKREAETAQARFEMYKLLRETSDNPSDILDATDVISKHMQHVKRIIKAETDLFTGPLETNAGTEARGYVVTLVKHVELRKIELESVGTLARLWKIKADEILGKDEFADSSQKETLSEAVDTLANIHNVVPQTIANMHVKAATKLAIAAIQGHTTASLKWNKAFVRLGFNGSSSAKVVEFAQYTDASDACIAALEAAIALLNHQSVAEHMDKKDVEDLLLLYYQQLCEIQERCIGHNFGNSCQLSDKAKDYRRKKVLEWNAEAEKIKDERRHAPEIMELRKKMDEATQTPEFRQYVRDATEFKKLKQEWLNEFEEKEKHFFYSDKRVRIAEEKKDAAYKPVDEYQKSDAWSQLHKLDEEAEKYDIDKFVIQLESDVPEMARTALINWFGFGAKFNGTAGRTFTMKTLLGLYECARILEEYGVLYSIL